MTERGCDVLRRIAEGTEPVREPCEQMLEALKRIASVSSGEDADYRRAWLECEDIARAAIESFNRS